MRKYPIGIQTFSRIIKEGYVYIDKTDLVWKMTRVSPFVFLSRPRRFGKSLLSSTLHSYFDGDRELFEGLKIMQLEKEWNSYPVLHFDLSKAKSRLTPEALTNAINLQLNHYEEVYGDNQFEITPGEKLNGLVTRVYTKTGKQVVVIVDEYDAPLLDVLHEDTLLGDFRRVMQEFYQPLKACEPMIRFCFITGITKFSQLSIFSTLNNLKNISLIPTYASICGITENELVGVMGEDIRMLASRYDCFEEEMLGKLRRQYDGYHFAPYGDGVYNPFSLLNAFDNMAIGNYWFDTGTPSFLIRQMQHFHTDITAMDDIEVPASAFDRPTEAMTTALPLLYQSGYLTIKDYDREGDVYNLSIPNQEVRVGFTEGLLPTYVGLDSASVQTGFALKFWRALKAHDIDRAMRDMQAFLAGVPYVEGFKKKLAEAATAEGFYEYTFYLIFSMLNVYVRTQVKCAGGRIDMVVYMPDTTYILELKTSGTTEQALAQIKKKGYDLPYHVDGHAVVKVAVLIDKDTRTIKEWKRLED